MHAEAGQPSPRPSVRRPIQPLPTQMGRGESSVSASASPRCARFARSNLGTLLSFWLSRSQKKWRLRQKSNWLHPHRNSHSSLGRPTRRGCRLRRTCRSHRPRTACTVAQNRRSGSGSHPIRAVEVGSSHRRAAEAASGSSSRRPCCPMGSDRKKWLPIRQNKLRLGTCCTWCCPGQPRTCQRHSRDRMCYRPRARIYLQSTDAH